MDRNRATYEAFDGVELRLLDGHVVRCPALSVAEAIHYLRLLSETDYDVDAAHAFLNEFPARVGIADVPLSALGFEIDGVPGGHHAWDVTVSQGLALLELLGVAQRPHEWTGALAKFMEAFPKATGISTEDPWEMNRLGSVFAAAYYEAVLNGFARSFLSHLRSSPRARVMVMTGADSNSTSASTT